MMWSEGVSFVAACDRLAASAIVKAERAAPMAHFPRTTVPSPAPRPVFPETEPPSALWQARARQFVAYAQGQLWQDDEALAYLRDRGLSDDTAREAGLGYSPKDLHGDVGRWGQRGTYVWLPRGWVIPCESRGVLWYVKIRRHRDDLAAEAERKPDKTPDKYRSVKGSKVTLYGLETLARDHYTDCVICEGEFDALLLRQHVGCLCGCVALGSATKGLDMQAVSELVAIRRVWLALDADKAGQDGAKKLLEVSARIHPLPVPAHDATDAWKAGHDLVDWVVPRIGPRDRDRRLMWLKYQLDKLGDAAEADDGVWRVWQALLAEHKGLRA